MRKIFLIYFFLITFVAKTNAQELSLELTKVNSGRVLKIKEDKRVVVKTKDKERFVGKIKFIDNNTILIDEKSIKLDDIKFIRKRNLSTTIIATSFIVLGAFTLGLAPILVIGDTQAALTAFLSSVGISSFAILLPSLSKKYSNSTYNFQIIELTN